MKTKREIRDIAPVFFELCSTWQWVVDATPLSFYPPERDPISTVHEAECARGPVRTNAENLALPGTLQPVAIAIPAQEPLPSHYVSFSS